MLDMTGKSLFLRLERNKTFLKKTSNFFLWKNVAECQKMKRGTLWDSLTYILLQNIKKTRRGDAFQTLKNFRKTFRGAEKN